MIEKSSFKTVSSHRPFDLRIGGCTIKLRIAYMIDLDFDDVDSVAYLPPDLLLRWWPGNQIPLYSQINTHKIGLSSSQADTIAATPKNLDDRK